MTVMSGRGLTLDWDDQLGDDGEDLGSALFEHVEGSLDRQETVRVVLLTEAFEEHGQVVVIV